MPLFPRHHLQPLVRRLKFAASVFFNALGLAVFLFLATGLVVIANDVFWL